MLYFRVITMSFDLFHAKVEVKHPSLEVVF